LFHIEMNAKFILVTACSKSSHAYEDVNITLHLIRADVTWWYKWEKNGCCLDLQTMWHFSTLSISWLLFEGVNVNSCQAYSLKHIKQVRVKMPLEESFILISDE
jgi:hypothetical protein